MIDHSRLNYINGVREHEKKYYFFSDLNWDSWFDGMQK